MMPIWWVFILVMSTLTFICLNSFLFYMPLINMTSVSSTGNYGNKMVDMNCYDL